MIDEEKIAWCALNKIFGFKPEAGLAMIHSAGSASALFNIPESEIRRHGGSLRTCLERLTASTFDSTEAELRRLKSEGCIFITQDDEAYPPLLKDCPDAPLGIYYKGTSHPADTFCRRPMIAIVGTRDITPYGKYWCQSIVAELSKCSEKPSIVSGLALGTDIVAHTAALETGCPTVAVMATGIDEVYPFRHGYAADRIATSPESALVTDYPPHTPPVAINFVRRNRIIAGICQATILIESKAKGGGMITARLAHGYNREVYALPGRLNDIHSAGCNILISDRTASAFSSCEDLAYKLGLECKTSRASRSPLEKASTWYREKVGSTDFENLMKIVKFISEKGDVGIDNICAEFGWSWHTGSTYIYRLESDGFITIDILQRCSLAARI